jgi:hypothetical protein
MKVPNFKDPDVTKFLIQWDQEIRGIEKDKLSAITGNRSVLLYSPSKKVYELTVDDSGVLAITKVAG